MQIELKKDPNIKNSDQRLHSQGQSDDDLQKGVLDFSDIEHGPYEQSQRQCKDVLWFILFWGGTVAMIGLSTWALLAGSPSNIYRATDEDRNVCGKVETPTEQFRYSYFYNPTFFNNSKRVCIKNCPRLDEQTGTLSAIECFPDGPACVPNITVDENGQPSSTIEDFGDHFIAYDSRERIDRICRPEDIVLKNALSPYSRSISDSLIQSKLIDYISDVQNNWGWFVVMCPITVILCVLAFVGLRYCPGTYIWISIFISLTLFTFLGFLFLYNGGALTEQPEQGRLGIPTSTNRQFYNAYGGVCFLITLFFIIVVGCCYHKTTMTVEMIRLATRFISELPTILVATLGLTVAMCAFWATAISSTIYALSEADFEPLGRLFTTIVSDADRGLILFWYFLFIVLWTHETFVCSIAFGVASSVAKWYFRTGTVSELEKPVFRSMNMIIRYHFGSLAFGCLVLLVVQFLQFIVEIIFFFHQWKYGHRNRCVRTLDNCLHWIRQALQHVTKRVNRYAYIQIALRGKSFIEASKDGFNLVYHTSARYGYLISTSSITFFFIRLSIAVISVTSFYVFVTFVEFAETSILEPIYFFLIIFYVTLGISSIIIGTYSVAIDSILTCYIIDQCNQQAKDPNNKPLYGAQDIAALFDEDRQCD